MTRKENTLYSRMMSTTERDFGYPEDFFSTNQLIRKLAGLWIPGPDYDLRIRIAYMTFVIILHSCGITIFIWEFIYFFYSLGDISIFVSIMEVLPTDFVIVLKFSVIAFRMKKIRKMMDDLQSELYIAVGDFSPGEFMRKQKIKNSAVAFMLFSLYCSTTLFTPIASFVMMEQESFEESNLTCYDFMPCPLFIPYPTNTKFVCQMTAVIMGIGFLWSSVISASYDTLFIGLLSCLKNQLHIVCHVFKTVRERALLKLDLPENYDILYDSENPVLEKELYFQLKRTTKHLMTLLSHYSAGSNTKQSRAGEKPVTTPYAVRIKDDMEDVFTYVNLGQCITSLFVLASCLCMTSSVPVGSTKFYIQILYSASMSAEFSLYCWYGNEMTIASEAVASSLYESNWYSGTAQYKNAMIITMTRMQRPAYMTVGKFAPLTLNLMIAVYKASFSYYTVFKEVQ